MQLKVATNAPGDFELYNVVKDVSEESNVAAENPAVVQRLKGLLGSAHTTNPGYPLFPSERK